MNEVVRVSISGVAFTFDRDAYGVMNDYLKKLEAGYAKHPDGREIITDIEARIAELILERGESDRVIGKDLAVEITQKMGYPDDMDTDGGGPIPEFPRRLYRNPDCAKFAGICSGLGAYFRIDPVWIRLAIFAPLLLAAISSPWHGFSGFWSSLFGFTVLAYFILWMVVPMAKSPRQKLEMRGEKITADSIRQEFEDDASAMNCSPRAEKNASVWADIMYVLGRILQVLIKVVVFFMAFTVGIVVLALFAGIIAVLIGGSVSLGGLALYNLPELAGISVAAYSALFIAVLAIPLFLLLYWLLKVAFSARTNRSFVTVMWVVWSIILVWFIVMTVNNADRLRDGAREDIVEWFGERIHADDEDREDGSPDRNGEKDIRFGGDVTRIYRADGGPVMLERKNGRTEAIVLPATGADSKPEHESDSGDDAEQHYDDYGDMNDSD